MLQIFYFSYVYFSLDENVFRENNSYVLNLIMRSLAIITHVSSLLTIAILAIDRFISVKYCLRYQLILTTRRIITGVQWVNLSQSFDFRRNSFITLTYL